MKTEATARVRPAAQAGRFYPSNHARLQSDVDGYLAVVSPPEGPVPKAIIAPHAGYMFSATVAASAFVRLAPAHDRIRRVILMGPSHYADFDGLAVSGADAFATPLGLAPVDAEGRRRALELPQVTVYEQAHAPEHSLEVELPFLQTVLDRAQIVPLLVGEARAETVAAVLEHLWGGDETCVVISSDLSHYLDHATAQARDRATAEAITALHGDALDEQGACGWRAIRGLLLAARRRGLRGRTLDLRNSGDTVGARDRVVGYGAFVFGVSA
jgi:hypothetical protein